MSWFDQSVTTILEADTVKAGKLAIDAILDNEKMTPSFRLEILQDALSKECLKDEPRVTLISRLEAEIETLEKDAEDGDLATVIAEPYPQASGPLIPPKPEGDTQPVIAERVAPLKRFTPHPDLERIAMMEDARRFMAENHHGDSRRQEAAEDLASEWEAFIDEIRENGVLEPVKVIAGKGDSWTIVDGRHRWQAATEAGLGELPFVEVDSDTAQAIMEGTIAARRNYTKGQKAFAAVIFHPELLEAKPGPKENSGTECRNSNQDEIAAKYGVSPRLLRQSIELHQKIQGKKRISKEVELQVWSGLGLGGILSGLGGKEATVSKPRRPSDSDTVSRTLKSFTSQVAKFDEWPREERQHFADDLEQTFSTASDALKRLIVAVIEGDEEAVEFTIREGQEGGQA